MKILVRSDSVEIEGYVNAVERKSKPIITRMGKFVERICKGAFKRAIDRNDDIRLLLNHDWSRDLGGTKDGTLELREDSIGLKAHATITDADVVQKARAGDLVGWSFGFSDRDVERRDEDGMPTREVRDMDLYEVSILDRRKSPAYDGTLISVRSETETQYNSEPFVTDIEIREETPEQPNVDTEIDYSKWEQMIAEMKNGGKEQNERTD